MGLAGVIAVVASGAGTLIVAILAKVLADDAKEWTPLITEKLVGWAAARVPEHLRERCWAEWAADVADKPGVVAKLIAALSLQVAPFRERERFARECLEDWDQEFWDIIGRMEGYVARLNPHIQAVKVQHHDVQNDHEAILDLGNLLECEVRRLESMRQLDLGLTTAGSEVVYRRLSCKLGLTQLRVRLRIVRQRR